MKFHLLIESIKATLWMGKDLLELDRQLTTFVSGTEATQLTFSIVPDSVADTGAFFTGSGYNDFGNHGSGSLTEKGAH